MLRFFKRGKAVAVSDTTALGGTALAVRVASGVSVPAGCVGVVFDPGGKTRRVAQHGRISLEQHEGAFCFHPGPYTLDLVPFAAAPEMGLRMTFAVDSPDPRVLQQRFDVFLMSEAHAVLTVQALAAALQSALQRELAQGHLELAPCTSPDEWNTFRAGLNQLVYLRFGLTVDDCLPVDLGEQVDYARLLLARAQPSANTAPAPAAHSHVAADTALADALALRRLFLELPCVASALRVATLPPGQANFRRQQNVLQRLDRASLMAATMPALELAAPGQLLAMHDQARRAGHSGRAAGSLDEAWALLARLDATCADQLYDDADRIVANLELHLAGRHTALPQSEAA